MKNNQPGPIKNVIFDFGAVLLDWHPDRVYRDYFPNAAQMEQFYRETQIMIHNRDMDRGVGFDKILKELVKQFPHYQEPLMLWKNAWHKMLGGAIEGTVEILYALQKQEYRLFGLTNWSAETFPYVFYSYEFFQVFEDILVSGREGLIKPEPEIFELCLSRNQLKAHESLFIDDNLENVRVARALGLAAIHFQSPQQLKRDLAENGIH